jgi:hypothetical protein
LDVFLVPLLYYIVLYYYYIAIVNIAYSLNNDEYTKIGILFKMHVNIGIIILCIFVSLLDSYLLVCVKDSVMISFDICESIGHLYEVKLLRKVLSTSKI